jgi:hypothetical protein
MVLQGRPGGLVALRLGPGPISLDGLKRGSPCWLTSDPQLESQLHKLAQAPAPERQQALDLRVSGALGSPLVLEVAAIPGSPGGPWRVASTAALEAAQGAGLDRARLEQQLGRLGGPHGGWGSWRVPWAQGCSCPWPNSTPCGASWWSSSLRPVARLKGPRVANPWPLPRRRNQGLGRLPVHQTGASRSPRPWTISCPKPGPLAPGSLPMSLPRSPPTPAPTRIRSPP